MPIQTTRKYRNVGREKTLPQLDLFLNSDEVCESPKLVDTGDTRLKQVVMGESVIYAQLTTGEWASYGDPGDNRSRPSEMNQGSTPLPQTVPSGIRRAIPFDSGPVTSYESGNGHSLIITARGDLYSRGDGSKGQTGHGHDQFVFKPQKLPMQSAVLQISAGFAHSLALDGAGAVWAWGDNSSGQCGVTSGADTVMRPHHVALREAIVQITAGAAFSLFLGKSGAVYSCGENDWGQLGQGCTESKSKAGPIALHKKCKCVSASSQTAAAVTTDGLLAVWGRNDEDQLPDEMEEDEWDVMRDTTLTKNLARRQSVSVTAQARTSALPTIGGGGGDFECSTESDDSDGGEGGAMPDRSHTRAGLTPTRDGGVTLALPPMSGGIPEGDEDGMGPTLEIPDTDGPPEASPGSGTAVTQLSVPTLLGVVSSDALDITASATDINPDDDETLDVPDAFTDDGALTSSASEAHTLPQSRSTIMRAIMDGGRLVMGGGGSSGQISSWLAGELDDTDDEYATEEGSDSDEDGLIRTVGEVSESEFDEDEYDELTGTLTDASESYYSYDTVSGTDVEVKAPEVIEVVQEEAVPQTQGEEAKSSPKGVRFQDPPPPVDPTPKPRPRRPGGTGESGGEGSGVRRELKPAPPHHRRRRSVHHVDRAPHQRGRRRSSRLRQLGVGRDDRRSRRRGLGEGEIKHQQMVRNRGKKLDWSHVKSKIMPATRIKRGAKKDDPEWTQRMRQGNQELLAAVKERLAAKPPNPKALEAGMIKFHRAIAKLRFQMRQAKVAQGGGIGAQMASIVAAAQLAAMLEKRPEMPRNKFVPLKPDPSLPSRHVTVRDLVERWQAHLSFSWSAQKPVIVAISLMSFVPTAVQAELRAFKVPQEDVALTVASFLLLLGYPPRVADEWGKAKQYLRAAQAAAMTTLTPGTLKPRPHVVKMIISRIKEVAPLHVIAASPAAWVLYATVTGALATDLKGAGWTADGHHTTLTEHLGDMVEEHKRFTGQTVYQIKELARHLQPSMMRSQKSLAKLAVTDSQSALTRQNTSKTIHRAPSMGRIAAQKRVARQLTGLTRRATHAGPVAGPVRRTPRGAAAGQGQGARRPNPNATPGQGRPRPGGQRPGAGPGAPKPTPDGSKKPNNGNKETPGRARPNGQPTPARPRPTRNLTNGQPLGAPAPGPGTARKG